ncbi:LysR family transcriptional regulator [Pandoraea bronchicola]|uniref:Transcriptional regulator n=1 Tax=Pandoraea bronchicola TaxID=2508287 RepID=A0A5E5BYH3_9BURK|nr:LysR family transcriptional regulator [Pandoraea bronchicola]VVE89403.1 transcriptional regulator [Pandoraea bronchicola]
MDLIDQLRIFVRVAHHGNFGAAAEQLSVPRPTVSLAIQQLEERLGVRLLNRTTRRVSLTQDGIAMLDRAATLVADSDELLQQFQPHGIALSGRLKVDLPSRIARRYVAPRLPDFLSRFPGVEIELGSSDRLVDLVHEGIDCALRVGEMSASSLVVRPLGTLRLINCASPAYLARYGTPMSPEELPRHVAVNYAISGAGRNAPWEWISDGVVQTSAMCADVTVNNAETYIAAGMAGLGLIQIPAFDVNHHLEAGDLVEVLHAWPAPQMPIQIVYPHRRHMARRVQVFIAWLSEILAPCLDPSKGMNRP